MLHKKSPAQTELAGKSEKAPAANLTWVAGQSPEHVDVRLKVVPGSRKDEIVGTYGDRLKVKIAAPPEDGKANAAVCRLLATALGISVQDVQIIAGATNPEKVARIARADAGQLLHTLR